MFYTEKELSYTFAMIYSIFYLYFLREIYEVYTYYDSLMPELHIHDLFYSYAWYWIIPIYIIFLIIRKIAKKILLNKHYNLIKSENIILEANPNLFTNLIFSISVGIGIGAFFIPWILYNDIIHLNFFIKYGMIFMSIVALLLVLDAYCRFIILTDKKIVGLSPKFFRNPIQIYYEDIKNIDSDTFLKFANLLNIESNNETFQLRNYKNMNEIIDLIRNKINNK